MIQPFHKVPFQFQNKQNYFHEKDAILKIFKNTPSQYGLDAVFDFDPNGVLGQSIDKIIDIYPVFAIEISIPIPDPDDCDLKYNQEEEVLLTDYPLIYL